MFLLGFLIFIKTKNLINTNTRTVEIVAHKNIQNRDFEPCFEAIKDMGTIR